MGTRPEMDSLCALSQATHGQFVQKKTLADFDKLEKDIKARTTTPSLARPASRT